MCGWIKFNETMRNLDKLTYPELCDLREHTILYHKYVGLREIEAVIAETHCPDCGSQRGDLISVR